MIQQKAISVLLTVIFFTVTTGFNLQGEVSCKMEQTFITVAHAHTDQDASQTDRCLDHVLPIHLTTIFAVPKAISVPDVPSKRTPGNHPYTFTTSRNETILSGTELIYYGTVASLRTSRHQSFTCSFLI